MHKGKQKHRHLYKYPRLTRNSYYCISLGQNYPSQNVWVTFIFNIVIFISAFSWHCRGDILLPHPPTPNQWKSLAWLSSLPKIFCPSYLTSPTILEKVEKWSLHPYNDLNCIKLDYIEISNSTLNLAIFLLKT